MQVVDRAGQKVERIWAPVSEAAALYVGQLVSQGTGNVAGVTGITGASSGPDSTNSLVGIIEAFDYPISSDPPTFSNTSNSNTQDPTAVITQAQQVARGMSLASGKGPYVADDTTVHAQIALLTPWTKVRVALKSGTTQATSTAPTLLTVTSVAVADGSDFTSTATADFTPVAGEHTAYCRTGANAGQMRIGSDTSTTVFETTNIIPFKYDIAVNDTFVRVPLRPFGASKIDVDALGMYFDVDTAAGVDHFLFNVLSLHLDKAGEEYVVGTFDHIHFDALPNTT